MDIPILLVLIMLIGGNKSEGVDTLYSVKNYLNGIELDYQYTNEKIRIAKKLRPYLPNEYSDSFNKSISITEKLIRLIEVKDFIESVDIEEIHPIDLEPTERVQKIVNVIQEEVKNSKLHNLGFALELIANMDNYKKMFSVLTTVIKEQKSLSDPNNLMKLMEVFIDGKDEKDKEKIKDLSKMVDLFKILDSSKKEKPNE